MAEEPKPTKIMPRGVRKGGTRFPRYELKDALVWARKLVSKTHLGPQPDDIIFASVVGAKNSTGQVKVSALRQYGLMDGSTKGYFATKLSKSIAASPDEDLKSLYATAALAPDIFRSLFNTFHGDEVSVSRIRQRAADLKIHPDEAARCVDLYISALTTAELATVSGEIVSHQSTSTPVQSEDANTSSGIENLTDQESDPALGDIDAQDLNESEELASGQPKPRAIFNVNVNLDSSLDTEKLERQLSLLKRFGAI